MLARRDEAEAFDATMSGAAPLEFDCFPPVVPPESQMAAKKKRYQRWDANPEVRA